MLTLTLSTTTDLTPTLEQLARRARLVAGEAVPTDAELADVREHVARELDATRAAETKTLKTELAGALPKGVRLKKLDSERAGLTLTSHTTLELDDVALLPQVVLSAGGGQTLKPFADFTVKKDKQGRVLSGRAPELPPGAGSLSLSLTSTEAPLAHNASSAEGKALTWQGSGFDVRVVFPA